MRQNHVLPPPNSLPSKYTSATLAGDLSQGSVGKCISSETYKLAAKKVYNGRRDGWEGNDFVRREGRVSYTARWKEGKKREERADWTGMKKQRTDNATK